MNSTIVHTLLNDMVENKVKMFDRTNSHIDMNGVLRALATMIGFIKDKSECLPIIDTVFTITNPAMMQNLYQNILQLDQNAV